jgi:hypothetical protein
VSVGPEVEDDGAAVGAAVDHADDRVLGRVARFLLIRCTKMGENKIRQIGIRNSK